MINVLLKIRDRGNINFILRHLYWFFGLFSDRSKYKIYLYNENVNLGENHIINNLGLTHLNRQIILQDPEVQNLDKIIKESCITPNWRPAALSLTFFPWYIKEPGIIINCDSDDLICYSSYRNYLEKYVNYVKDHNVPFLSHDMSFTAHYGPSGKTHPQRPSHLTYGINIGNRDLQKRIVLEALRIKTGVMPWGVNIDLLVDIYLERHPEYKYVAYTFPGILTHAEAFYNKYNPSNNTVAVEVTAVPTNRPLIATKHPRTLFLP